MKIKRLVYRSRETPSDTADLFKKLIGGVEKTLVVHVFCYGSLVKESWGGSEHNWQGFLSYHKLARNTVRILISTQRAEVQYHGGQRYNGVSESESLNRELEVFKESKELQPYQRQRLHILPGDQSTNAVAIMACIAEQVKAEPRKAHIVICDRVRGSVVMLLANQLLAEVENDTALIILPLPRPDTHPNSRPAVQRHKVLRMVLSTPEALRQLIEQETIAGTSQ